MREKAWSIVRLLFLVIALSAFFLTTSTFAADSEKLGERKNPSRSLSFGLWTEHWSGDHCEGTNNHLLAFEYDGWTTAWFKNSYGKETLFAGYGWHTKKLGQENLWIRGNLYIGALWGYGTNHPIHIGGLSPGAYPTASIGRKQYSLEVGVMPTFWWLAFKVDF